MFRQYLIPTGVPRGNRRPRQSLQLDGTGDVIMSDAPAPSARGANPVSDFYTNTLGPKIDPALALVANGFHRGVKRAATTFYAGRDRFFKTWVETPQSTQDGLVFKRFKRLPVDPDVAETVSKAELTNTLPVAQLKELPADQFCWSDNPLKYLGPYNHSLVTRFLALLVQFMRNDDFARFPDIHTAIDPRSLPTSAAITLQTTGKQKMLSIFLHNYMFFVCQKNEDGAFYESGMKLMGIIENFNIAHKHTYYEGGRINTYKKLGFKPYGPMKFPYTKIGADPLMERNRLMTTIRSLQFILSQRDLFDQLFPAKTFAGIIADFDAIRKDQPPPSYVDWPGKYHNVPGSFTEGEMDEVLFDTVAMRDFEPARLWDEWHPSPRKGVTVNDYDTPYRNAMKKNELFYDAKGHVQAIKPALRKEGDVHVNAPNKKKKASFVTGPVAFYAPSKNEPAKDRNPSLKSHRLAMELRKQFQTVAAMAPIPQAPTRSAWVSVPPLDEQTTPEPSEAPITRRTPTPAPVSTVDTAQQAMSQSSEQIQTPIPVTPAMPACDENGNRIRAPRMTNFESIDDYFERDDLGIWGEAGDLKMSSEKQDETDFKVHLIGEARYQSQREEEAEKQRKEEEERKIAEEKRRTEEEHRRKAEEERRRAQELRRIAEQKRIREEDERLAQAGELREPHQPIIPDLPAEWADRVNSTLRARDMADLATTPEGATLRQKDFETVVPQNKWLNDEIVNGTLMHLGNYVNQKVGIKNTRLQTPKIQVFNSFVGKSLVEGKTISERMLRKNGVRNDNFLDIEAILVPICRGKHWTLVAIRPKHRQILHLDSLSRDGDTGLKGKARNWVRSILGDAYVASEWTYKSVPSPHQSNMDDCGVHTITNGICIGLGVTPTAYTAEDMPLQRLRVAAVLLNGGFKGEFSLEEI